MASIIRSNIFEKLFSLAGLNQDFSNIKKYMN